MCLVFFAKSSADLFMHPSKDEFPGLWRVITLPECSRNATGAVQHTKYKAQGYLAAVAAILPSTAAQI
ncbi:hypothetical protein Y032_0128g1439 [Ancylostoma ceylanicum]|uniref:Uncharacterized protein n=1 Tax=Ancylostoma ceylanicum TaxID=53326 RepID=A0A016T837_9BILA|nr:hypothetical protein Y032_0128g1439 [Ancylostoma ceylanicum]